MVKDKQAEKTNGKQIIEALIMSKDEKYGTFVPVMATSLYIVTKDQELNKVHEIRVRDLTEE